MTPADAPDLRQALQKGPLIVGAVVGVVVFVVGALIGLVSGHREIVLAAAVVGLLVGSVVAQKLRRTLTTGIEAFSEQLAAAAAREVVDVNQANSRDIVSAGRLSATSAREPEIIDMPTSEEPRRPKK
ncbi:MAG: hypothetical protein Q8O67_34375 [Deltaproteobacteria bacterium]|nr:hypothetical protein [Deltaproteobacteria bacterium]